MVLVAMRQHGLHHWSALKVILVLREILEPPVILVLREILAIPAIPALKVTPVLPVLLLFGTLLAHTAAEQNTLLVTSQPI
jgi:hypothetical protein